MAKQTGHSEMHKLGRINWIRAGVLGANDGVVSIAALLVGLLGANVSFDTVRISGISALIAGAFSMAIGEYVSVSSQSDIEQSNIEKETAELKDEPEDELAELTGIYRNRGLSEKLAHEVAEELTAHNALEAHLRDELGISKLAKPKPFQASFVSFLAFLFGGVLPFIMSLVAKTIYDTSVAKAVLLVSIISMFSLCLLGYISAKLGGAPIKKSMVRIFLGGVAAFIISAALGYIAG